MKQDKIPITLRIDEVVFKKIKYTALKDRRSLNSQVEFVLEKFAEDFEKEYGVIPIEESDE